MSTTLRVKSKIKQDVYLVIGAFMTFWGIAFFAYYSTSKDPFLSSEISLIPAVILTLGGNILSKMASEQ
jgi:hypothetical protein